MNSTQAVAIVTGVGAVSTFVLSVVDPFNVQFTTPTGVETVAHAPINAAIIAGLMAIAMVGVSWVGVDDEARGETA